MAIEMINGNQVETKVANGLHIVNVFGTWCGPCQMFGPILEEVSAEIPVHKIDVDQNQDYAQKMQIQGVPSTFIFKDGELKDTIVGFVPKEVLMQRINSI